MTEWHAEPVHSLLRGDVEGGQAVFERTTACFDQRLLNAPYPDECPVFFPAWQVDDNGVLFGGEVFPGKQVDVINCPDSFYVDAHIRVFRKGINNLAA